MIALPYQQLEAVTRVAPLGLRFVDDATGLQIGGGLLVEAYPSGHPELSRRSTETRSGLHSFQDVPGLRPQEMGAGDSNYWASVAQKSFVIEVLDTEGRYLPAQFTTLAPSRGVSGLVCSGMAYSASGQAGVPLFSQASRTAPGLMGAVRAELWD